MRRVFISYRRHDSAGETGRLCEALQRRFGHDEIFRDIEDLDPGVNFPQVLDQALTSAKVMLVVIGPTWATIAGDQGRRIDEENDFVRREVATGLDRNDVRVIPVLVGGARLPEEKELPANLQSLHSRNATELSETRWDYDVQRLGDAIANCLGITEVKKRPGVAPWIAGLGGVAAVVVVIGFLFHPWSQRAAANPPSKSATLKFWIKWDNKESPNLTFQQKEPNFHNPHNIGAESDGHYQEDVDWLGNGKPIEAVATRVVFDTSKEVNPVQKTTRLCFARNPKSPTNNPPLEILMQCIEGQKCSLSPSDFGWAIETDCAKERTSAHAAFSLVPPVFAQGSAESSVKPGWKVPSLETLKGMTDTKRPGYTQFSIKANALPGLEAADRFRYQIVANGTPLYVDGWPPEDMLKEFHAANGLDFPFGMENLNFSGADRGCEKIDVLLEFRKGDQIVKTVQLSRRYAALRDAAQEKKSDNGLTFDWAGTYVKPKVEDKSEVFVFSTSAVAEASRKKSQIDSANLSYQGKKVVGVIRPPLDKPQYGVVVGLIQPSGQVKFTFDSNFAPQFRDWATQQKTIFRDAPFIYQMRPGESGTGKQDSCKTAS